MDNESISEKKSKIPDDFFYIVKVNMDISGCKLNFKISDRDLLQLISCDDCMVKSICFDYKGGRKSVLECIISTKDLLKTYAFITYELKLLIIKTLLLIKNVKDLSIDDNISCAIENEKEAVERDIPIIPYSEKYLELVVEPANIKENEFTYIMKSFIKNYYRFDDSLFWMYVSYSVIGKSNVKNKFDFISQYSILWTAFNAFYSKIYPDKRDREAVEAIAKEEYVKEYFSCILKSPDKCKLLKEFCGETVVLRKDNNVSKKLEESMEKMDYDGIALNAVLCLYAIRNAVVHGYAKKESKLCRDAFEILNPLIKLSIINKVK
ncbi:hypothetical protein [Clostridium luticellarii]|uniref:Apea-like HEPN domain-containing protein n=1 Tax=Clostridium luticellarii TaxID=1691940 RepID=A0A2T0BMZ3_9CLOT|nr:hypothetical protein [Clostridium luticellarii]PRR85249.1 hypothetical protein CLLU_18050 [Clostridium luticellarii]